MKKKTCNKCGEAKTVDNFYKDKSRKGDGLKISCKDCLKKYQGTYYKNNRENCLARTKDWADQNKEHLKECSKKYYEKNKDSYREYYRDNKAHIIERHKKYYQDNKAYLSEYHKKYYQDNKESRYEYRRRWFRDNQDKSRFCQMKRRAKKAKATPRWLDLSHWEAIENVYKQARDCEIISGGAYHVDHIVPLQGGNVCGLHVPWNLQVLPADLNFSKNNSFDGGW